MLFWIIIPVCFWSYQNDMQENTMGIFTLASVYFSLKAIHVKINTYLNLILSGVSIFLASMCKGVPGLFPLGVVGLYWLLNRDFSFAKMLFYTLLIVAIPVIIYGCLMLNKDAHDSLLFYWWWVIASPQNFCKSKHRVKAVAFLRNMCASLKIIWKKLQELYNLQPETSFGVLK